jgi:hypothetical protein
MPKIVLLYSGKFISLIEADQFGIDVELRATAPIDRNSALVIDWLLNMLLITHEVIAKAPSL